jgi:hypothetical protein
MKIYKLALTILVLTVSNFTAQAVTRTAEPNKIDDIHTWIKDGETTKIEFQPGVYEFSKKLLITNNDLVLQGSDRNTSILKLLNSQPALIDAIGNNVTVTDLTLDGNNVQTIFGQAIFRFNKSEGHRFERVLFTRSAQFGITGSTGWATDGLFVSDCEFEDIQGIVINILNRNTLKRGELVTEIKPVTIQDSVFREGYKTGITLDAGNDRRHDSTDVDGNRIGRRYTETVDMKESIYINNVFEKTKVFHVAGVQASNFLIVRNEFLGMTDDAEGGANSLHFEQFSNDIQIYNNNFYMPDTVAKSYPYINISATEGHKRVTQEQPSDTYPTWTFKVDGSNERRADTSCAATGHIDSECKRDVHAYGAQNLHIAGNTFNASTKISDYFAIKEGQNIQIGTKKNGTIALNHFEGGTESSRKITLSGNDEGTCNVNILEGQNITQANVSIKKVNFDLPHCSNTYPIIINGNAIGGEAPGEIDTDKDGIFDGIDPDDDNDGVNDELDAFPLDIKYAAAGTTLTFPVLDDADVDRNRPDLNLGTIAVLKLIPERRHSYVKFDVTGLDGNEGDLMSANLILSNHDNKPVSGLLDVYHADSDWDQSTLTWNILNDFNGLLESVNLELAPEKISVDLTNTLTTDGFYSFGFTGDGIIYSQEDANVSNHATIEVKFAVPSADFDGDDLPDLVDPDDDNDGVDDGMDDFPFDPVYGVLGDFDGDNDVDRKDISYFVRAMRNPALIRDEFDFNGDGRVHQSDVSRLRTLCTRAGCAE